MKGLNPLHSIKCPSTTKISTLSLHDALPIYQNGVVGLRLRPVRTSPIFCQCGSREPADLPFAQPARMADLPAHGTRTDRKSTRLNSSHVANSYAVFCLEK